MGYLTRLSDYKSAARRESFGGMSSVERQRQFREVGLDGARPSKCPERAIVKTRLRDCSRGNFCLMRWTQTLIPTLKETPADAEIVSHKLLLRAGLIRKLTGGLYTFLPLGLRAAQGRADRPRGDGSRGRFRSSDACAATD